jgi:hypothetical protein
MNDIELTQVFIDYARTKSNLETYERIIQEEILNRGESAKIAGVTATYYKPTNEVPDYATAAQGSLPSDFDLHPYQKVTVTTSWKTVCDFLGIDVPPGKEKPARVVIK